jgi:plastocyanin
MADWSVNIIQTASGASFVVDYPGAKQGQPLNATEDDIVSWYNQTNNEHQPWQCTSSTYNPAGGSALVDAIPAGQPSDNYSCVMPSATPVAKWTVYYCCKNHPNNPLERGTIIVKALAQEAVNILDKATGTVFSPQPRGANSGDPVNWNNLSKLAHQPWQTDSQYNPVPNGQLSDPIQPGDSSLVYFVNPPQSNPKATAWTVYYYCKLHPNATSERGTIVVPPPPPPK